MLTAELRRRKGDDYACRPLLTGQRSAPIDEPDAPDDWTSVEQDFSPSSGTYRAGLDGLRAIAVLAVVAYHTGLLRSGWVGVDLFMGLSGFLITSVIANGLIEQGRDWSVLRFWGRRLRRLLPGLLLLLSGVALVAVVVPGIWGMPPTRREIIGALTYTSNWLQIAARRSYFGDRSPLGHLWSLAVEEQFYVVWPLVLMVAWRRGLRRPRRRRPTDNLLRVASICAGMAAGWQVAIAALGGSIDRLYVGSDTRAFAFLAGGATALWTLRRPPSVQLARRLTAVGLSVVLLASVLVDGGSRSTYMGVLIGVSIAGVMATVGAAHLVRDEAGSLAVLMHPAMVRIGRWSYGIYLFHWPVAVLLKEHRSTPFWSFVIVASASIALAGLSYECFEHRIRRRGVSKAWALPAAIGFLLVSGCAFAVAVPARREVSRAEERALRSPLPASDPGAVASPLAHSSPAPAAALPAAPKVIAAAPNSIVTPAVPLRADRLLVVGDSVPFEMGSTFVDGGRLIGREVSLRAAPGCVMSVDPQDQNNGFSRELCASIRRGLRADVARFRPAQVLLFYGGVWNPLLEDGRTLDPCSAEGEAALRAAAGSLIDDVTSVGSEAILVIPPQPTGRYRRGIGDAGACYASAYRSLATQYPELRIEPLDEYVCPAGASSCDAQIDGVTMRHDGLHYTERGAAAVVAWMYQHL